MRLTGTDRSGRADSFSAPKCQWVPSLKLLSETDLGLRPDIGILTNLDLVRVALNLGARYSCDPQRELPRRLPL